MEKCTSTDNKYVGTSYKTRKKIQCMEGFHRNSNIYISNSRMPNFQNLHKLSLDEFKWNQ